MAHPEIEELMNALLPFAQQCLEQSGEFYPFGAAVNNDGEVCAVGADTGEENPLSQDVIEMITEGFKAEAANGQIRAAGICVDVTLPEGRADNCTDAMCCWLEHIASESYNVYLPYRFEDGVLVEGELFATPREPTFFIE